MVCCSGLRIVLMFCVTAFSFMLNALMPKVSVIYWYAISINIITFFIFAIDKYHALKKRKRVPEINLHFFSFAGGFAGAFLAIFLTRHKTKKKLFLSIQAIILLLWVVVIYYVKR